jgi:hypothetical protein
MLLSIARKAERFSDAISMTAALKSVIIFLNIFVLFRTVSDQNQRQVLRGPAVQKKNMFRKLLSNLFFVLTRSVSLDFVATLNVACQRSFYIGLVNRPLLPSHPQSHPIPTPPHNSREAVCQGDLEQGA